MMLSNNVKQVSVQSGVYLYVDQSGKCVDVEIESDVTVLKLMSFGVIASSEQEEVTITAYNLREIDKTYPNIAEIYIGSNVTDIQISNYMFPNVRNVKSESRSFYSSPYLNRHGQLYNVFCLDKDDVVNLLGCHTIMDYAFEGCNSQHIINSHDIYCCQEKAFYDSAFESLPYDDSGTVRLFGNIIIGFNPDAEEIVIPDYDCQDVIRLQDGLMFPDTMVVIHNFAHLQYYIKHSLTHLRILDKSVSEFKLLAFVNEHPELYDIEVSETNPNVKVVNNIIYTKDGTTALLCLCTMTGTVSIPDGVTTIQQRAFMGSNIHKVIFPNSLKVVQERAFSFCENLTSINFGSSINRIGISAFYGCTNLKQIELPDSLMYVGQDSFHEVERILVNSQMKHLPSNLFKAIYGYSYDSQVSQVVTVQWGHYTRCIPRDVDYRCIDTLNDILEDLVIAGDTFYQYVSDVDLKQYVALHDYMFTSNESAYKYLRRVGKKLANNLLKTEKYDEFLQLLDLDVLSKVSLNELLMQAQDKNSTVIAAYILNKLKTTEHSTFRL